tara:strand:- start:1552 stop:1830 length:279 start_codon:yes stop_codon:yes gene_type:complete
METLLSSQTANGSGAEVNINDGGFRLLRIYGTFDSATATLEINFNGSGTWVADSGGAFTSADQHYLNTKAGMQVRLTVSSAGGSTSLNAEMI